ncbi:MAG: peptidoglycan-binding domain-containing protein [Myxococcota bacterium]
MARWDTVVEGRGLLTEGDTGDAVRELQQHLRDLGFKVAVDGVFGPITASAVCEFQARAGVFADGVVGRRTARALCAGRSQNCEARATGG